MVNGNPDDDQRKIGENMSNAMTDGGKDSKESAGGARSGKANSLTGIVDTTLESQDERETTARDAVEEWESNASEETNEVIERYEELEAEAGEATDWELSLETEAGELVDELTHDTELGVRDYAEHQSEQIEGLTGTVRRFGKMIQAKNEEIQEREEKVDELEEERQEEYDRVQTQIEQMDEEDLPEGTTWNEYADAERSSVDSKFDRLEGEIEEEIEQLEETKGEHMETKMAASSERDVRRDETQEVYNSLAGEAETVVSENTSKLKDSLGVLRELETQQKVHEDKAVEDGLLDQRQEDQAEARTEAAMAYVSEALEEIDELESAVEDHYRVKEALSSATQVETRDLQSIYDELADPEAVEAEIEGDEYGTEVLRQRVFEAATTIVDDGYDSVRELREIADNQAGYTEEE